MQEAPVFYAGKKLSAKDLIGLEEYLLSINSIKDETEYGVARLFPYAKAIRQISSGVGVQFVLDDLKAITPSGKPIVINDTNAVGCEFLNQEPQLYDIYIESSHEAVDNASARLQKYRLFAVSISDDEDKVTFYHQNNLDSLFIGRYKIGKNVESQMIIPPLPLYLSAIRFPSPWWIEWTLPIREALREIAEKYKSSTAVTNLINEIAYYYAYWPLKKLIIVSRQLNWLIKNEEDSNALTEAVLQENLDMTVNSSVEMLSEGTSPLALPYFIRNKLFEIPGADRWQRLSNTKFSIEKDSSGKTKIVFLTHFNNAIVDQVEFRIETNDINRSVIKVNDIMKVVVQPFLYRHDSGMERIYFIANYVHGNGNFTITLDYQWQSDYRIYYRNKS